MKAIIDLLVFNFAAISAFLFRENFGEMVVKQPPSFYWQKYLLVLIILNILSVFIFWVLGLYDRRQKRALLEEFILIFGVISTSIAVLVAILFVSRMWWVSRTILYLFWFSSVFLLSLAHYLQKKDAVVSANNFTDLNAVKAKLASLATNLKDENKQVSIIIVNYNGVDKLNNCLLSLKEAKLSCPHEIIVVDNNSVDGSVKFLQSNYPAVRVVANATNSGFSRAANQGLSLAQYDICLILNPDIIVFPGAIDLMLDYLMKHQQVGLVGCKLFNQDGSVQDSVRRFLDLRTYFYRFTPLRGLLAGSSIERFYLMHDWDHNSNRLVDWVLGRCMMVKKAALKDVGLMDENIFLYFDDVDWCYRMWQKKWQVAYVASAAMLHKHERASANKIFNRATYEHIKSLFYFLKKHGLRLPQDCPSNSL